MDLQQISVLLNIVLIVAVFWHFHFMIAKVKDIVELIEIRMKKRMDDCMEQLARNENAKAELIEQTNNMNKLICTVNENIVNLDMQVKEIPKRRKKKIVTNN